MRAFFVRGCGGQLYQPVIEAWLRLHAGPYGPPE